MASPDSPLLRFRLWRAGLPTALRLLLTANVVTYVAWVVLSIFGLGPLIVDALALQPSRVAMRPWTALTYAVAGVGPYFGGFFGLISFLFAVFWLSWLGREFEELYGAARLFGLYVMGALAGAALALFVAAFVPVTFGTVFAGAWGGVAAVLCATAVLHPEKSISLLFLGVVPIRWLAIGFVVLDLAFVRDPTHLGAALMGTAVGAALRSGVDLAAWARPLFESRSRARPPARPKATVRPMGPTRRSAEPEPADAPEPRAGRAQRRRAAATQAEVDRILDKISERGLASLSDDERRVLDEYSRRN
jgi:membrane associated rhomboid family serine protease